MRAYQFAEDLDAARKGRDRDCHHRHWRLIDQFYAVGRLSAVL
jgi:hypothetical protein